MTKKWDGGDSTVLWQDEVSRTVADKVHLGTIITYEEFDKEANLWVPVQRVAVPTEKYTYLTNFLSE